MVFALSACFMMVQVVVGWWTNSLALLADAAHLFVDAAGVGLSLLAVWFAERPATAEK
ncbi:MAG: cation transporter, partial [Candidatus Rokubacteria bacterium]|nr:cation transporter [Candidatus Rokubacteria bacterium]